ncbi:DUF551 domain-containing protein [Enterobacter sp.]
MTIKPVAGLYLIKYEDGRLYKCTRDAEEAVDAIGFGFEVEEFVSLDNHRAAMLQGADTEFQRKAAVHDVLCKKYNVESLEAFVDWQRNHIAELEAAPPAPVGPGETAVMPDYPGYTMTQRECFQAGKKAGMAEAGNSLVVPDGWVACSERMPEVGVKVLCFPVNDEPIHATYNGQVWLQDISWSASDEPIDNVISCNVFHWMPLPAAPQQEVKP